MTRRSPYNETSFGNFNPQHNVSFSGADIVASITPPKGKPRVFGEMQTISYSIHRELNPVRSLGRINPKGIVRGPRTIAGSLVFTVFDRHIIQNAVKEGLLNQYDQYAGPNAVTMGREILTDEMPPFDVTISFVNEYGSSSMISLFGVHVVDEGQVMSIDDMITENTMSYIALDIDLMSSRTIDSATTPGLNEFMQNALELPIVPDFIATAFDSE